MASSWETPEKWRKGAKLLVLMAPVAAVAVAVGLMVQGVPAVHSVIGGLMTATGCLGWAATKLPGSRAEAGAGLAVALMRAFAGR